MPEAQGAPPEPRRGRLFRGVVVANTGLVLVLTFYAFSWFHFIWLPSWWPPVPGGPFQAPFYFVAVAVVLLVCLGAHGWCAKRLFSMGQRRAAAWGLVALFPIVLAALFSPIQAGLQLRAAHRARPLLDAIQQYETDHGNVPQTLEALIPDYLDRIPTPGLQFSRSNRFVYVPVSTGDRALDRFVLAFGVHVGGVGGDLAVVYCPEAEAAGVALEEDARLVVPLPAAYGDERLHTASVELRRRLDRGWVFADSE
jgi:hypothetical protein